VPARLQRIAQADTAGSLASSPAIDLAAQPPGQASPPRSQRLGPRHRHVEPLRGGADASPDHFPVLGEDAELALALVEIESDIVPGWPPRRAALTA